MNETCQHIESLLSAFVGGDLGADEAARVRAHLESCDVCRASLAAFAELEQALVARRSEVPPVERFLPEFAGALVAARESSRIVRWFRGMMTVPGIATILVVWGGFFTFEFRDKIGHVLSFSTPDNLTVGTERFASLLVTLTSGNVWLLIAACTMVAFGIAASTGAMTYRYIRQH
jgi:anti-sigma factor RsiW